MAFKILSTLLLAASLLMAQRGGGGGGRNTDMGADMGLPRPEPLDQLSQMLKLTREQRKEARNILDETQKEVAPLRESMNKSREQIAAAVEGAKSQDEIDKAVKDYAALEGQVSGLEAQAFTKIFKGLDNDQKANGQGLVASIGFLHEAFKRKNWNILPSD